MTAACRSSVPGCRRTAPAGPETDPRGWWLSEKLDGVRAYWDGKQFLSRNGNRYVAPEWFTRGLPDTPLDGELWVGRKQFQRTVSIVRRSDGSELWREVRYLVFDAPALAQPFEQRQAAVTKLLAAHQSPYALGLAQSVCQSAEHLTRELHRIEALGGEGLMLRRPASLYEPRRSATLLKVKSFHDCEAVVIGHEPGKGRHKGRLGALLVALPNGIQFACGTGLSDAQRDLPPAIGETITVKFQELTEGGVPRFPVFAGVHRDEPANPTSTHNLSGKVLKSCPPQQPRVVVSSSSAETPTSFGKSELKGMKSSLRMAGSARPVKRRASRWSRRQPPRLTRRTSFSRKLARATWRLRDCHLRPTSSLRTIRQHRPFTRRPEMGARSKLNGAVLNGSLLIGGLVALASGSPLTGVVIGAILAVISVIAGDIRLSGRK